VPSLDVETRSSLVSSRKLHAWKFRRSEGGIASETLRCLVDVETETEVEAGSGVAPGFEVKGKGEGVDVDVVMTRLRIVADVGMFEEDGGTANGLEKEKVEEEDDIV
jgi:hypothetical protein